MYTSLPASTLINVFNSCSGRSRFRPDGNYHPQFALLLGAGASKPSGVATASELVESFRRRYIEQFNCNDLDSEKWYSPETAYATLFERLYPEASLRRDFIEQMLEFATPSWGYFYLVDLLRQNIFNAVFTTNFDDLLNEACYLFSSTVRPINCAHDSSVRGVRISSKRPKIIKLHGDFLFDSLKNTLSELESLEQNMRDKFKQYAKEYGLIVIGYSGQDRSIMDILDALLGDDTSFPHGVFWCTTEHSSLSSRVDRLTRHAKFHVVRIAGFDEFMAELHDSLNSGFHPAIENPHVVASTRMGRLLFALPGNSNSSDIHPLLERDIIALGNAVRDAEKLRSIPCPYVCQSLVAIREGRLEDASKFVLDQLRDESSSYYAVWSALHVGLDILIARDDPKFSGELFNAIEMCPAYRNWPQQLNDQVLRMISSEKYEMASRLQALEEKLSRLPGKYFDYVRHTVNKCQIRIWQKKKILKRDREFLETVALSNSRPTAKYCALILLNRGTEAIEALERSLRAGYVDGSSLSQIVGWPITDLLDDASKEQLRNLAASSK